jgi:hypothetical protein
MRRWLLALLALLVTAQLSWAGAVLCCVSELADHDVAVLSGEPAQTAAADEAHPVCETGHCHCHHTGCAAPLAQGQSLAAHLALAPESAAAARVRSHTPQGLDRPNWQRA